MNRNSSFFGSNSRSLSGFNGSNQHGNRQHQSQTHPAIAVSDDKGLRRLDSFARLLLQVNRKKRSSTSPCVAVAIVNDELYITQNGIAPCRKRASSLQQRLKDLRILFLEALEIIEGSSEPSDQLEERIREFLAMKAGFTFVPGKNDFNRLYIDFQKILNTALQYNATLEASGSSAFKNFQIFIRNFLYDTVSVKILTVASKQFHHAKDDKNYLANFDIISEYYKDQKLTDIYTSKLSLKDNPTFLNVFNKFKICDFHAEQILAYYLRMRAFNSVTQNRHIYVGISDLCCVTCEKALQSLQEQANITIIPRGYSLIEFAHVINFWDAHNFGPSRYRVRPSFPSLKLSQSIANFATTCELAQEQCTDGAGELLSVLDSDSGEIEYRGPLAQRAFNAILRYMGNDPSSNPERAIMGLDSESIYELSLSGRSLFLEILLLSFKNQSTTEGENKCLHLMNLLLDRAEYLDASNLVPYLLLNPDNKGCTPLHYLLSFIQLRSLEAYFQEIFNALDNGWIVTDDFFDLLLDPNIDGFTPIFDGLHSDNPHMFNCYLES